MINPGKTLFGPDFFELHQDKLVKFVNTSIGRWFFRIHGKRSSATGHKIIKIAPNYIKWNGKKNGEKVVEFRAHNKFSKRLLHGLYSIWWLMHQWDMLIANRIKPVWNLGFDTLTAYSGSGDGYCVEYSFSSGDEQSAWDDIHDASSSSSYDYTSDFIRIGAFFDGSANDTFDIYRGFLPFDTSSLPINTVVAATLTVDIIGYVPEGNVEDGREIGLVQTTQSSTSSLSDSDYNQCGSTDDATEGASRVIFSGFDNKTFTLNSTGRGWINKTGYTKLGLRSELDLDDVKPTDDAEELGVNICSSEETGTSSDPKLIVTYSTLSSISITFSIPEVTATSRNTASVSPITLTLLTPTVTSTYIQVETATTSSVGITSSTPNVTATFIQAETASVSPVGMALSLPEVTATYLGVWDASVSPSEITLATPNITATYIEIDTASVSSVEIALSLPTVTALAICVASLSPVVLSFQFPTVTAKSYQPWISDSINSNDWTDKTKRSTNYSDTSVTGTDWTDDTHRSTGWD